MTTAMISTIPESAAVNGCTTCPLCQRPGTLAAAAERVIVPCNIRKFSDRKFTVWRCTGCNCLHAGDPADLDFYYAHLPFHRQQLDTHTRIAYNNRLRLLRKRGLRQSDSIIDFGCGAGLFIDFLREKGYGNVVGYDAYVDAYADTGLLDRTYDAVVSYDVIEHMDDTRAFLDRLTGLVAPNGLLVIGTPNADGISLRTGDPLAPELSQPYHRHLLSETALRQLVTERGFSVEHAYHRFYFDTLIPGVNTKFIWSYISATGGMLDAAVEKPKLGLIFRSPRLLCDALFGYLYPPQGNMLLTFRKLATTAATAARTRRAHA